MGIKQIIEALEELTPMTSQLDILQALAKNNAYLIESSDDDMHISSDFIFMSLYLSKVVYAITRGITDIPLAQQVALEEFKEIIEKGRDTYFEYDAE